MTKEQLKKWRARKKLTQEKAANSLGLKVARWRKWEYGINPIPSWLELLIK